MAMIGKLDMRGKLLAFALLCVALPAMADEKKTLPASEHPQPNAAGGAAAGNWATKEIPSKKAAPSSEKKSAAAPSPCKGLDATACSANKACSWVVPKDANDATGKVQEPYCRKAGGSAAAQPAQGKPVTAKTEAKQAPASQGAAPVAAPAKPKAVAAPAAPAVTAPAPAAAAGAPAKNKATVAAPASAPVPPAAPAAASTSVAKTKEAVTTGSAAAPEATSGSAEAPAAEAPQIVRKKAVPAAAGLVVVH